MMIAIVALNLFVPTAVATVADPRWNGTWREVPARSRLFVPGEIRVRRDPNGAYSFADEETVRRCGGSAPHELACSRPAPRRFEAVLRSSGPPPATTRWRFDLAVGSLVVTTRTATPCGPAAVDWSRYRKIGGPGLTGIWRKVADGETPTIYRLSLARGGLHVSTADGLLDFRSPLLGRGPTVRDAREHDHVYGAVTPAHLIELSFDQDRLIGRSDLRLAHDGASFVERHLDARGHAVSVYFARDGGRRDAGTSASSVRR